MPGPGKSYGVTKMRKDMPKPHRPKAPPAARPVTGRRKAVSGKMKKPVPPRGRTRPVKPGY